MNQSLNPANQLAEVLVLFALLFILIVAFVMLAHALHNVRVWMHQHFSRHPQRTQHQKP